METAPALDMQAEFLGLLTVVTSMCDHVIEYIEADRAERRLMIETLAQLSQMITSGAAAAVAAAPAAEHVIGGSMPAGPEPTIDLWEPEPAHEADSDFTLAVKPEISLGIEPEPEIETTTSTTTKIAVEVRGRFGDRWVDGFEICEVTTTPSGLRYRLRRHRDGVVLPELFDATSIRHVETFDELNGEHLNGVPLNGNGHQPKPEGANGNQVNGSGYWSRS